MKLHVNGEWKTVNSELTLKQLLEKFQINAGNVVVEHNEVVISRPELESTTLREGDKVEIVQFVGGG